MNIDSRLSLSYYKEVAVISEPHKVYVVQHIESGKIFLKKILDVYNRGIYEQLRDNPICHTPKIYEIHEENNQLFVIEEYISGDTLDQLIERADIFDDKQVINIITQLCRIVREFHSCTPPIIHRDIKPSNIIFSPSGELFLLDFNAAKYYSEEKDEDTSLLGTKGYAAPEQYGFGVSTQQTDIYAVGMVLQDLAAVSYCSNGSQKNDYSQIIAKCTKMDISNRYRNVDALLQAFSKFDTYDTLNSAAVSDWKKYLPPGFQKLNPFSMLFSGTGYLFLIWMVSSMEIKLDSDAKILAEKIICLLVFLSVILCSTNYLGVQSYFPPCRTKNPVLRVISVIFLNVLVILGLMTVLVFVEALL